MTQPSQTKLHMDKNGIDDFLISSDDELCITSLKQILLVSFHMKELGHTSFISKA